MIDFKGNQFFKDVIFYAVWVCVRFPVSYRGFEQMLAKRGIAANHATLNQRMDEI